MIYENSLGSDFRTLERVAKSMSTQYEVSSANLWSQYKEKENVFEDSVLDAQFAKYQRRIKAHTTKKGTVTLGGQPVQDAQIVTDQFVPMGPAASQIAIKQSGTNGGGYNGVNSAHPLENPTWFSNLVEMISLLLIPAALCFTFGRNIKDKRQGRAIFSAMLIMLIIALSIVAVPACGYLVQSELNSRHVQ